LLSDGVWINTWDAENRILATETTVAVPAAARAKETWTYYPDGRWNQRVIFTWTNNSFVAYATNRFLWDAHVIVAILDHTNGLVQSFMRGLDLSGTMQGAGGTSGLLAISDLPSAMVCLYAHEANGNVAALVNGASGTVAARYEYGCFAEPIRMSGMTAKANPMRFSGQFADDVRGTVKYLFRDYDPSAGRWISRDPIGERGGINLYAHARNTPGSLVDILGLAPPVTTARSSQSATSISLDGAWEMFLWLYIGDLNQDFTISGGLLQLARQNLMPQLKIRLQQALDGTANCCQYGHTNIHINDMKYAFPEKHTFDFINMGTWQARMWAACDWHCGSSSGAQGLLHM